MEGALSSLLFELFLLPLTLLQNMPRQALTFKSLPTEIITRIFILSSNPSLVLICRELNHILAPLSKSTAIRTEFLLVRYRNNYVKAVVKGLRWAFFDLELLNALDRLYRKAKTSRRLCKASSTTFLDTMTPGMSSGQKALTLSSTTHAPSPSNPNTSRRSDPQEPPRKKRKSMQRQIRTSPPQARQRQQQQRDCQRRQWSVRR